MAHVTAAERRPQLIKAAIDLMTRKGVAAGSTRAIATELGVAQATLHYTFGSKEDLYAAVLTQITEDLVAQLERAAPSGGGFAETLAALAGELWRSTSEPATNYQLLTELIMVALRTPGLSEARESHYRQMVGVTTKLVAETAERTGFELSQPADVVARFFLAGFDGLTMHRLCLPDEAAEHVGLQAMVAATVALASGELPFTDVQLG
ncbi:TetR/AcrR family transcriptional regulator [Nocardia asteroides]|uniref:TetR/AcrR family transcriptional regulator n=1 Tax=Nocardia asteroides TaxID=1824 RepID=UPI003436142E